MTGYRHPTYAHSFAGFGRPRHLPRCNGWLLERQIPGTPYRDAMGCYPLFSCHDWGQLPADLADIDDLVSLTLVPAPFDDYTSALLASCFDRVVLFKKHFVADLERPITDIVKPSHWAAVRRAQRRVRMRHCQDPAAHLDKWTELFAVLAQRHGIRGLQALSREAFALQLAVPGAVLFEALAEGQTVGLDWWYVQDDVAYGHLVAFSEEGYRWRASYASKWRVICHFSGKVRWLDLGGGAGASADSDDGLSVYKQGWATDSIPVYLCGRIFQPDLYRQLTADSGYQGSAYFPAYRTGEFA